MSDHIVLRVAAAMWRAEAIDAGTPPSVIAARSPEAFAEQSDYTRARWEKFARAALAAASPGVRPLAWEQISHRTIEAAGVGSCYRIQTADDGSVRWQSQYMGEWHDADSVEAAKDAVGKFHEAKLSEFLDLSALAKGAEAILEPPEETQARIVLKARALKDALVKARPYVSNMAQGWPDARAVLEQIDAALIDVQDKLGSST